MNNLRDKPIPSSFSFQQYNRREGKNQKKKDATPMQET